MHVGSSHECHAIPARTFDSQSGSVKVTESVETLIAQCCNGCHDEQQAPDITLSKMPY